MRPPHATAACDRRSWELLMDTVEVKGSNLPLLRQALDAGLRLQATAVQPPCNRRATAVKPTAGGQPASSSARQWRVAASGGQASAATPHPPSVPVPGQTRSLGTALEGVLPAYSNPTPPFSVTYLDDDLRVSRDQDVERGGIPTHAPRRAPALCEGSRAHRGACVALKEIAGRRARRASSSSTRSSRPPQSRPTTRRRRATSASAPCCRCSEGCCLRSRRGRGGGTRPMVCRGPEAATPRGGQKARPQGASARSPARTDRAA